MALAPVHEFISGSLGLDFVDTIGDRAGANFDRLNSPEDLQQWFTLAGLNDIPVSGLDEARCLRDAIETLLADLPGPFDPSAVEVVNAAAAKPDLAPQLPYGARIGSSLEAALSTIARDIIGLLRSDLAGRIRRCEGCAMWMVDRSRPGLRRWCSSDSKCGNRERLRRHRNSGKQEV
jgi:predicted RNA-binding Zn ribbon-like protein